MNARAWAAFAGVSMFWGMPYLLIKVAVDDSLPPVFVTWVRVVLGAVVLLVLARRRGLLGTLRGRLRWLIVMALVEITLPFTLIAIGEQHVSSSLAAVVIAAAPTFVVLLALRFDPSERAGGLRLAGLALGLGGVAASVGIDVGATLDQLLGGAAILAAALCYAIGPMVFKRHLADLDPRASMGASLTIAALLLTPLVVITISSLVGRERRAACPRVVLHGRCPAPLRPADRRSGSGAGARCHLHQPARCARAWDGDPWRAARRRRRDWIPAHPCRLLACDPPPTTAPLACRRDRAEGIRGGAEEDESDVATALVGHSGLGGIAAGVRQVDAS